LGKPSIFSREYEKKMKKRKRNVFIVAFIIVLVISVLVAKIICNPIDYGNVRKNIQAWIDSDNTDSSKQTEALNDESNDKKNKENNLEKDELQRAEDKSFDIALANGSIAKAIYIDDNKTEGKMFKSLDTDEKGVVYSISQSGKEMMVTDTNSVITLYNVDGSNKIVSKDQYVSTKGGVFTKEDTIRTQPGYLWNSNPKFISEEKIIFVSNRPYFGNAVSKQYLWMTDIQTGEDKIFWEISGQNIEIGEKEDKGIKITIDNRVCYIDENGNFLQ
jgi:hypothetical protein